MASTELSAAEAQWREQYTAMRAALANLKIPSQDKQPMVNGELDDSDFEGYSSGTSGQGHDVWDFISDDDDDEDSSDFIEPEGSLDWFSTKCAEIAEKNGMSPDVFQTQISSALSSGLSDEEVQMQLTDLVGFDDLDFIIEVLGQKDTILADIASQDHGPSKPTGRILTKAQREDALRRQDLEHKTASLAPSQKREVHYPHVYKSYSAGNTLSYQGKKYALPAGNPS